MKEIIIKTKSKFAKHTVIFFPPVLACAGGYFLFTFIFQIFVGQQEGYRGLLKKIKKNLKKATKKQRVFNDRKITPRNEFSTKFWKKSNEFSTIPSPPTQRVFNEFSTISEPPHASSLQQCQQRNCSMLAVPAAPSRTQCGQLEPLPPPDSSTHGAHSSGVPAVRSRCISVAGSDQ